MLVVSATAERREARVVDRWYSDNRQRASRSDALLHQPLEDLQRQIDAAERRGDLHAGDLTADALQRLARNGDTLAQAVLLALLAGDPHALHHLIRDRH